MMVNRRFANYAWGVLALNLIVIIWGAFVRATGSGAGCGSHWPLCNGEIIPQPEQMATVIEFSHRITSGIALLAVLVLLIWGWRAYPKGHMVRRGVVASAVFMLLEALIGAGLVLLQYVEFNVSVERAIWMAGHLINTFLLTGALALTAWWAEGGRPVQLRGQGSVGVTYWLAVLGMMLLGVSGAITALGDTLVLTGGIRPEDEPLVATLVQLRVFHPLIAFVTGGLLLLAVWIANSRRPGIGKRLGRWALGLFVLQLLLGALNVQLQAPVWLQLVHLLLTCLIWILVVLFGSSLLARPVTLADPHASAGAVPQKAGR